MAKQRYKGYEQLRPISAGNIWSSADYRTVCFMNHFVDLLRQFNPQRMHESIPFDKFVVWFSGSKSRIFWLEGHKFIRPVSKAKNSIKTTR